MARSKPLAKFIVLAIPLLLISCAQTGVSDTATPPEGPPGEPGPSAPVNSGASTKAPSTPVRPDDAEVLSGEATVESIQINVMESFPVQVSVTAKGTLNDGCTSIDQITTVRDGSTFQTIITTSRPVEALCTEALVPFEETFPLEVEGLKAGTYTVDVNGISATFTLAIDNLLGEEPVGIDVPAECMPQSEDPMPFFNLDGSYCLQHPLGFAIGDSFG